MLQTSSVLRKGNSYESAEKIFAELLQACDSAYESESISIFIKKTCFGTLIALPDQRQDIPDILSIDNQITVLERSRRRILPFSGAFEKMWGVEHKLGTVWAELAVLYASKSLGEEVLAAARASAELYTKKGVELLVNWYSAGTGPK